MANLYPDPTLVGEPPGATPLTTAGLDPTAQLLQVIQHIQQLNRQPLIPDDPLSQMGAIFQGFSSGIRGTANPAIQQALQARQQQVGGLAQQASIMSSVASIEHQRRQEERQRKADERAEVLAGRNWAKSIFDAGKDSDDLDTRIGAFRAGQQAGLIGQNVDPVIAAQKGGKEYERKKDQVLTIIERGGNPFGPEYAGQYDPRLFAGLADEARKMVASGDRVGLNGMRSKPMDVDSMWKIRYEALSNKAVRTEDEERELETLRQGLKLEPRSQNTTLDLAKAYAEEDLKAGITPKPKSVYIERALKATDRSESFEKDLDTEAAIRQKAGQFPTSLDELKWKQAKRLEYQTEIAERKAGAQPLPVEMVNKIATLRDAQQAAARLTADFTPQERAQYVGIITNPTLNLLQIARSDPKFAQFQAIINRIKTDVLFGDAGKALTGIEKGTMLGWVITGKEMSVADFEAKLRETVNRADTLIEENIALSVNPRSILKRTPTPKPSKYDWKPLSGTNDFIVSPR